MAHPSPSLIKLATENFPCHKSDKIPAFTGIPTHVTILTMLKAIRTSQYGMADEVSGNIIAKLSNRETFGCFSKDRIQFLLEGMWNKVEYGLRDSQKSGRSIRRVLLFKRNTNCV